MSAPGTGRSHPDDPAGVAPTRWNGRCGPSARLYRLLAAVLAPGLQRSCGAEMERLFAEMLAAEVGAAGPVGWLRAWVAALSDLLLRNRGAGLGPISRAAGSSPASPSPGSGGGATGRLEAVAQDLRFAARSLRTSPGFTAVAVLSLAVAIGANATVFTAVDAFFLRPLPVPEPDRLVRVFRRAPGAGAPLRQNFSWVEIESLREARSFEGLFGVDGFVAALERGPALERVSGELVTDGYFEALGVDFVRGRGFLPGEVRSPVREPVAVLSHALWQRLGAPGDVVGSTVEIGPRDFSVVGVAAEGFRGDNFAFAVDVWLPATVRDLVAPLPGWASEPDVRPWLLFGRLAPGIEAAAAGREVETRLGRGPGADEVGTVRVLPERAGLFSPESPELVTLVASMFVAVMGLVLLVACSNVASLMLARAASRHAELATRSALGAGRGRLLRQLLLEGALLALPAAGAGLLASRWTGSLFLGFLPPLPVTLVLDLAPDLRVAAFTLAAGIAATLATALLPALHATRPDAATALRHAAPGRTSDDPWSRRWIDAAVMVQLAVSTVVLVVAVLFLRTLVWYQGTDPGFAVEDRVFVRVDLAPARLSEVAGRARLDELRARLAAIPGVRRSAVTHRVPMGSLASHVDVRSIGGDDEERAVAFSAVGPGYLEVAGIPLLRGRAPDGAVTSGPPQVVVNETLARSFWPGTDAIGQRLLVAESPTPVEVVGVAADSKYVALAEAPRPYLYLPFDAFYRPAVALELVVDRGTQDTTDSTPETTALATALRRAVRDVVPDAPPAEVQTATQVVATDLWAARTVATLAGGLGLFVLLLASVGLHGVMAFTVSRRSREIGIRKALGATAAGLRRRVLADALRRAGVALALGTAAAMVVTRALSGVVFGVTPLAPSTYLAVAGMLLVVALLAAWVPASRAAAARPADVLRC